MKICVKCGGDGPFGKSNRTKDGLRLKCKSCTNADNRKQYHRDVEHSRSNGKQKYRKLVATEEGREQVRARYRAVSRETRRRQSRVKYWRDVEQSREKSKLRNRKRRRVSVEKMSAASSAYFKKYPEKRRIKNAKSRQKRYAAAGVTTAQQFRDRVEVFGAGCSYCDGPYEHMDHLQPIALGGSNWPANLRPACASCNHRKRAMPAADWLSMTGRSLFPLPLP